MKEAQLLSYPSLSQSAIHVLEPMFAVDTMSETMHSGFN
jgi:hypothetical protein